MNILMLMLSDNPDTGGMEKHARELSSELARLGHTVTLAAATPLPASELQVALDAIILSHTRYWNVSLSIAFGFDNVGAPPTVFASAGGVDDRFTSDGAEITFCIYRA